MRVCPLYDAMQAFAHETALIVALHQPYSDTVRSRLRSRSNMRWSLRDRPGLEKAGSLVCIIGIGRKVAR